MKIDTEKALVRTRTFVNGKLHYEHTERRVVYLAKDGTAKINWWQGGRREVKKDPDGVWTVEVQVRSIQTSRGAVS